MIMRHLVFNCELLNSQREDLKKTNSNRREMIVNKNKIEKIDILNKEIIHTWMNCTFTIAFLI